MLNGIIVKIQSQKENDWGRYTIDSVGKEILAVGVIPNASIGMNVTIEGGMETNKYGTQYKITSVLRAEDDQMAGVRTFLANGYMKGIGLKTANEMIRTFGRECVDMFETEDGRTRLEEVKGLGKKSILNALASYEENKKYKDIVLFLNGAGTKDQVTKIYNKYGDKSLKTLKKNPYCLQMDLTGFGFKKADSLAIASGIKKNSIYRIMAGIKYVIEEAQQTEGHCYLPIEEIEQRVLPLLVPMPKFEDISEKIAENALSDWDNNKEKLIKAHNPSAKTLELLSETDISRELIKEGLYSAISKAIEDDYLVNEDGNIYTKAMYATETSVAKILKKMCDKSSHPVRFINTATIDSVIKETELRKTEESEKRGCPIKFEVTGEQKKAAYLGLMNRVCIISGGPGRGKTAISEIIAKSFLRSGLYYDKNDVLMLAPTGKAAKRITESTGYSAMTVHRAVLSVKNSGDIPQNKLILVDESSMIDIFLMLNLVKFAKDCNLIFVGDVNQIASVGPGKVLKDLIESEVIPCIILKEGHRNSGSIAKNSDAINAGLKHDKYLYDKQFIYKPFTPTYLKNNLGSYVKDRDGEYVVDIRATEHMQNALVNDYIENIKIHGIQNVMLCVAMNERGDICTTKLNNAIQNALTIKNPAAVFGKTTFHVGDRVMQIKNDYNFIKISNEKKLIPGVFNGDTGTIAKIEPDYENESYKVTVKFDDGCIGGYTKNTIQNLQLAYAITIHKCQGSEADCLMIAYSFGDYMLLNRSLFYTGVTRGKKICYLYGEEKYQYGKMMSAFDIASGRVNDAKRYTMLKDRLKEEV